MQQPILKGAYIGAMSKIDAVILTYKPDEKLKTIVARLKAQSVKPDRILIMNTVDKNNTYASLEAVRNIDGVTVVDIEKEEFDHGATRDRAMELCEDSEYVMFMTQDALPKNKFLVEKLLNALEAGTDINAVAYARQEPEKGCNIIERYTRSFNYTDESHSGLEMAAETNNSIKSIFCSDVCAMYNRRMYDEVGGFPANAIFNEDMVFAAKAIKANKDVIYEPKAVVIHSHNYTGMQYFKRYFDMGVSQKEFAYILKDYHSHDEGIRLVIDTAKYLCRRKKYIMLIPLVYHSGCKFVGLHLGKMHKKLPDELVEKCTMNKGYWKKKG